MPSSDRVPTQQTMGSFFGSSPRETQAPTTAAVPTAIPPPAERNVVHTPPATPAEDGEGATTDDAEQDTPPPLAPIAEAGEAEENPAADEDGEDGEDAAGAEEEDTTTTPVEIGETTEGGEGNTNPLMGGLVALVEGEWAADPESLQDLTDEVMSAADEKLRTVYGGDTIHRNDGRHLRGGVDAALDGRHMTWHDRVIVHPHSFYSPPM